MNGVVWRDELLIRFIVTDLVVTTTKSWILGGKYKLCVVSVSFVVGVKSKIVFANTPGLGKLFGVTFISRASMLSTLLLFDRQVWYRYLLSSKKSALQTRLHTL